MWIARSSRILPDTAEALRIECAALLCRGPDNVFVTRRTLHWPPRARTYHCDHPWVCATAPGPVPLADPDDAPNDPELAVPVRGSGRQPAPRMVLYGHHINRERIDPDEVTIIHSVSRAAGLAYMRLDYEMLTRSPRQKGSAAAPRRRNPRPGP
jgi:hypothetical protein